MQEVLNTVIVCISIPKNLNSFNTIFRNLLSRIIYHVDIELLLLMGMTFIILNLRTEYYIWFL